MNSSSKSSNECLQIIHQLVRNILSENRLSAAYGQQLLQVSSQWLEPNAEYPAINILPSLVCKANEGDSGLAAPVTAAWQLVRLGAKLLDDVEDGEVADQVAGKINVAIGFLFIAQSALWELLEHDVPCEQVQHLCQALNHAALRACSGQHLDLVSKDETTSIEPDVWLDIARAKSGEFLAWATWSGALVAGACGYTLACYHKYGYHMGVLLQVADDFNGVWNPNGVGDLAINSLTLSVCYALSVTEGGKRERLGTLLKKASDGDDAAEVQVRQMLIDLGAQAYLLAVGRIQYQQALTALQCTGSGVPVEPLVSLLDSVWPAVSQLKN